MSIRAKLRICAQCKWIYDTPTDCPQCGFASYGARYVYGNKAYRYKKTQEPWKIQKMIAYELKLDNVIKKGAIWI
jgi:hypothetical protein